MALQYLRRFGLAIDGGRGPDFSNLRCVFRVEQQTRQTPNTAEISIYNVSRQTAQRFIDREFARVVLSAGYEENCGQIYVGGIKFVRYGQETPVDKRLDLFCGDGDQAYNHAVVSKTLPTGWTQRDVIDAALEPMKPLGVALGFIGSLPDLKMNGPRVLFDNSKNILRDVAKATGAEWSIQNERLQILGKSETLPGGDVVLTSETGMIGLPTQTPGGIIVRSLIDPRVKPGCVLKLNNASIQRATPDLSYVGERNNAMIPDIALDGRYKVFVINRIGDTHGGPGGPWFNEMTCLAADKSGYTPRNLAQYLSQ